jgi:glycosyltransferase involved in cell wall biosynthesis
MVTESRTGHVPSARTTPVERTSSTSSAPGSAAPQGDSPTDPSGRAPALRIGLIAPPWIPVPPTTYGGTELVVDTIARGLAEAGHDVVLVATADSTCPVPRISVFETAPRPMNTTAEELRHVQGAYEALAGQVDVIHDHTLVGPVWALAAGVTTPIVSTAHGIINDLTRGTYAMTGKAVRLTAISFRQQQLAGDLPFHDVIHHGLDPARFDPGPGDGGYLMFVGRMSFEKGVREAVLIARGAGLPILVASKMREDVELDYFEREVRPVADSSVVLLGELSPAERDAYLRRAIALVNPIAWEEPFGLTMIEALALGTPAIVTRRGAAPEIITDGATGFVVDDVEQGVAAVARIGEIDRDVCREAVESYFSSQRMVGQYELLYRDVLARAAARAA